MKALRYVEIDVPHCALTYGEYPCEAVLGDTGSIKCFNSLGTCQDRSNFDNDPVTYRYAKDADYLPKTITALPSILSIRYRPTVISLGEDLGIRPKLTVRFGDHRHADTPSSDYDKYLDERTYDPFTQGSYWGKFRARNPFLRGRDLRWIQGLEGEALADMDTRHFIIDSFTGPNMDGTFEIAAKDPLKLAARERVNAPALSTGRLSAAITDSDTSATLKPADIGEEEYPASGKAAIGGKEIVSFTRSGDDLTITRAQEGTEAQEHDEDDRVQLCLEYSGEDPADIIYDLLVTYAGVDASLIPLSTWQAETANHLGVVYSAVIAEPTPVEDLLKELVEQCGLALWYDELRQLLRLQVLRSVSTNAATFTEENVVEQSLRVREQPDKRVTQVWTYFAIRNPLEDIDDEDNYRSVIATIDTDTELDHGSSIIKKIFARWIPFGARSVASRLNDIILSRYKSPPRNFMFDVYRHGDIDVKLAGGYKLEHTMLQDETGAGASVPIQITSLDPQPDLFRAEAEEMLFDAPEADLLDRVITIDSNVNDVDLEELHNNIYPELTDSDVYDYVTLRVVIESNVIVGSTSTGSPAFNIGNDFPTGLQITLENRGRIQGKGGDGGEVTGSTGEAGEDGGTALKCRFPIYMDDSDGETWGGGGGGGTEITDSEDHGGGGGAGQLPGDGGAGGSGGNDGDDGTTEAGGDGGSFFGRFGSLGDGGDPGEDGHATNTHSGGSAGAAIDGISNITRTASSGDIKGSEIN